MLAHKVIYIKVEIHKCRQILCAHKTHLLMPGHILPSCHHPSVLLHLVIAQITFVIEFNFYLSFSLLASERCCSMSQHLLLLLIIITSNDDIQPSTVVSNQLPRISLLVMLIIYG